MIQQGLYKNLPLLAAFVFFIVSAFMLIDQRGYIRQQEEHKQRIRKETVVLRDEWRNLQLEYVTLTGYNELHQRSKQLGMVSPRPGQDTFLYLAGKGHE